MCSLPLESCYCNYIFDLPPSPISPFVYELVACTIKSVSVSLSLSLSLSPPSLPTSLRWIKLLIQETAKPQELIALRLSYRALGTYTDVCLWSEFSGMLTADAKHSIIGHTDSALLMNSQPGSKWQHLQFTAMFSQLLNIDFYQTRLKID